MGVVGVVVDPWIVKYGRAYSGWEIMTWAELRYLRSHATRFHTPARDPGTYGSSYPRPTDEWAPTFLTPWLPDGHCLSLARAFSLSLPLTPVTHFQWKPRLFQALNQHRHHFRRHHRLSVVGLRWRC